MVQNDIKVIDLFKRYGAFVIDVIIASLIGYAAFIITLEVVYYNYPDVIESNFLIANHVYNFVVLLLIVCKDLVFRNASIGKKILKLKVVTDEGNIPSIKSMILRNLLFLIFPINGIVILSKGKKIEDILLHLNVVSYNCK